jgi:ADP-ribose pyrophosphatase
VSQFEKLTNETHVNLVGINYKDVNQKDKRWVYATRNDIKDLPCSKVNAVFIGAVVNSKLCIIKEFRAPLNGYQYSIPAGLIEGDEKIEETIARELREESGLEFVEIAYLSPPLPSSPGITDEVVRVALVKATGKVTNKNATEDEDIQVELADYTRMKEIMTGNDLVAAPALSAIIAYVADQETIMGLENAEKEKV